MALKSILVRFGLVDDTDIESLENDGRHNSIDKYSDAHPADDSLNERLSLLLCHVFRVPFWFVPSVLFGLVSEAIKWTGFVRFHDLLFEVSGVFKA